MHSLVRQLSFGIKECAQLCFHPIACELPTKSISEIMGDIFAEALADTMNIHIGSQPSSLSTSLSSSSQGEDSGNTESQLSDSLTQFSSPHTESQISVSDSDDENDESPNILLAGGYSEPDHRPCRDPRPKTCKRPSSDTEEQQKQKIVKSSPLPVESSQSRRPRNFRELPLKLTKIVMANCDDVELRCIGVQRSKTQIVPVPLWNQYTVSWKTIAVAGKWIVVSNYERWVMQLVDALTSKSVRAIAKKFCDKLKNEFQTCLWEARRPVALENPFEKVIPDRERVDIITEPTMAVKIGGHSVTCLNHACRMVLRLDTTTAKFILDWVVPFVNKLAHSQALPPSPSDAVRALANFHLIASPTPNIRDKVQWCVNKHFWEITVKKSRYSEEDQSTALNAKDFQVDPRLCPAKYQEAQISTYRHAIAVWNKLDGSNRFRIPEPWLEKATPTQATPTPTQTP